MTVSPDPRVAFLEAALWHGPLEPAAAILAAHPDLATRDIHVAAVLGDEAAVRRHAAAAPATVSSASAPYGGDPLTYLALSKYLRLDPARSDAFLRTATVLLEAGASAQTGFWTTGAHPEFETALYGAAGVAHHAAMTRLLLARGADPNDEEAVYHSPEGRDLGAMQALVETGRVTPGNLAVMLVRKHDWHDYDGAKWLLEHGASPNWQHDHGWSPLHHALLRDNDLEMIALLLDHGADPTLAQDGITGVVRAAWGGRGDVLALFARRGVALALTGVDALIAACAQGDASAARAIAEQEPAALAALRDRAGTLLATFAGTGNAAGVALLLDLGVDVAAPFRAGDGYWDEAPGCQALHVAAWRAQTEVVRLLLARGAPVDVPDAKGRTPLALAVKACVDSYWTEWRSPESVAALLAAGATVVGVPYPCGYGAVDALLGRYGARVKSGDAPL